MADITKDISLVEFYPAEDGGVRVVAVLGRGILVGDGRGSSSDASSSVPFTGSTLRSGISPASRFNFRM